jgi:hypothetical protein
MTNFFFIRDRNSPSNLASIKNDFVSGNADERLVSSFVAFVSSRGFTLRERERESEREREREREEDREGRDRGSSRALSAPEHSS